MFGQGGESIERYELVGGSSGNLLVILFAVLYLVFISVDLFPLLLLIQDPVYYVDISVCLFAIFHSIHFYETII